MVDRKQLERLQEKARNSGMVCNFFVTEQGYIDAVYYRDRIYDPLTFAEKERARMVYK